MECNYRLRTFAINDVDRLGRRGPRGSDEDLLRVLDDVPEHDGEARRLATDGHDHDIVLAVVFDVREWQSLGYLFLIAESAVDDLDRGAIALVDLREVFERVLPCITRQRFSVFDVPRHDNACSS
jgi:hypothetical protein